MVSTIANTIPRFNIFADAFDPGGANVSFLTVRGFSLISGRLCDSPSPFFPEIPFDLSFVDFLRGGGSQLPLEFLSQRLLLSGRFLRATMFTLKRITHDL